MYDSDGNVKKESAKGHDGWNLRPTTLPQNILARPLASFIGGGTASIYDTTQNTYQVDNFSIVDPTHGLISLIDTMVTMPAALLQSGSVVRTEDSSFSLFDIHYDNVTQMGSVLYAEGAVVVVAVPGEDEYLEIQIGWADYHAAALSFVADTTQAFAMGNTWSRSAPTSPLEMISYPMFGNAAHSDEGRIGGVPCEPAFRMVRASASMATDPCGSQADQLVGAAATLAAWGVGGAFCSIFCQAALPFIGKGLAATAVGTVGFAAQLISCRRRTGTGSIISAPASGEILIPTGGVSTKASTFIGGRA